MTPLPSLAKGENDGVRNWLVYPNRDLQKGLMIGLLLVTHGQLALEFKSALEHVVGPQAQLETICIGADDDMELRRSDIVAAAARADSGEGVIVLTDMFGGTPSNLAISIMDDANVEVLAGVNLPMLVKLASIRGDIPLDKAVLHASEAGKKYISVASQILDA
ncbi:MAG: PTS sugar transporter subunit IIA [Hyphomicrobiales bacterium]